MVLLTACSSTPYVPGQTWDGYEAGPGTTRYGLIVISPGNTTVEPVEVDEDDFTEAVTRLVRGVRPEARPQEAARRMFQEAQGGEALAHEEQGRVIRLPPVNVSGAASPSEVELTREYLRWCERTQGGGDCLRLLADGPIVRGEDRYALALAISLGSVLEETKHALRDMVEPSAVLSLLVWTATCYLLLWAIPDPVVSKSIAAGVTVALLGWLGVDTVWSLMKGWVRLAEDANRATSFEQVRSAGERFGRVMGENTARVLVMLAAAVLGGTVKTLAQKVPKLPGFTQASAQAEAQGGIRLAAVAEVEAVAASSEGTFSVLMKSPGSQAGAVPAGARAVTTVIRHQGGNRQVVIEGQRWHVPANKRLKDIPATDPMGDQLQAAAARAAQRWNVRGPEADELAAIERALAQGRPWLARLLERQSRGRFVERELRKQFPQLRWSRTGVDAVDPTTGYRYEVLSGTDSNLALHGQRMMDALFRMITF
jgi:hypothetical protein